MRIKPDDYRDMMLILGRDDRLWVDVCSIVEGPHGDASYFWRIRSPDFFSKDTLIQRDEGSLRLTDLQVGVIHALKDANFIEFSSVKGGPDFDPDELEKTFVRITKAGQDYLDVIENSSVWAEAKSKVANIGGGASLDVMKAIATSLVMAKLGLN